MSEEKKDEIKKVKMADGNVRLAKISNNGPVPYTPEWYEEQGKKREEVRKRQAGTC